MSRSDAMTWEAIGALAELFGAAAVVASLVYLARQLKMTRQVEQVSAFQGVFNGFTHHSAQFYAAPNELASRGLRDRDGLSHAERMLFDQLLANVLNQLEMSSWLIHAGLMQAEDVEPVDWWMEHKLFCYRGARDWLAEFGPTTYPPPFFARMERARNAALRNLEGERQRA
jgi:hypothetical protein